MVEAASDDKTVSKNISKKPIADGVAIGCVVVLVGTLCLVLVQGQVHPDTFVIIPALLGLGIWAARSASTRLRIAIAIILGLYAIVGLIFALEDLAHPESSAHR